MSIDILRIFAFIFIVMLHTLNRQFGIDVWIAGYSVISIGVNLFIMISGYLLLDKIEDNRLFFKKRVVGILPLFIVFNVIYIACYKLNIMKNDGIVSTTFLVYLYDFRIVFTNTVF